MPPSSPTRPNYHRVVIDDPEDFEINVLGDGVSNNAEKEENSEKISTGTEDQILVFGYTRNSVLTGLTWMLIVCTAGLLRLVFHWAPHWMLMATHVRCPLRRAQKLLIMETYQKHVLYFVKDVKEMTVESAMQKGDSRPLMTGTQEEAPSANAPMLAVHAGQGVFKEFHSLRTFSFKKLQYIWDDERRQFKRLPGLDGNISTAALHRLTGLNAQQQMLRRIIYGRNDIPVPVASILTLFFLEVLNPFYIFQVFSFCLWFSDDYYYYAGAIILLSVWGISASIIQTRQNQQKLKETVHSVDVCTVVRGENGEHATITTDLLVPGDVIVVPPHGCIMHCDAVLLSGNCIVNESMLTGESVPVTKTPLVNEEKELYDGKEHARHTLFCGTNVIQTRYYGDQHVYALVIRTGFSTSKGSLVRSIMYPPPVDFKFEQDSYRFVLLLGMVASIGFIYTVITKTLRGVSARDIVVEALDLITITVPPALPAAMTVGRMYAQIRLKANGIYCIAPRSINVSGSVDCVCFDKTGTLTEDGLDMWGVVPFESGHVESPVRVPPPSESKGTFLQPSHLLNGILTCHSLTIIDGQLSGDPLDLKMFESTGWILEEPDVSDNSKYDLVFPSVVKPAEASDAQESAHIGIVRQFPFSSALQRMSVITKKLTEKGFVVYCKGSPEMIVSLSKPETVPADFHRVLETYTEEGYRVLALAYKTLDKSYPKVQRLPRDETESELTMLGLIVLENKLKPETRGVIRELCQANIPTIMVTGDNMLTAVSVARDCGIVPYGRRVITVKCVDKPGGGSQVTFSNKSSPLKTSNSTTGGCDFSQATTTLNSSVASLNTMETGSAVTDLDFSSTCNRSSVSNEYVFAIEGSTWQFIRKREPELIPKIITRGAVFARMSPDQKQDLIFELQGLGYFVAMCGDGANDCGALKAAHTGISLSDAESSVASPFTSRQANISCVPLVVREGRAALVTSFGIFKYMAAYSLTQFISVMILYSIESNLADLQYLFIDLFIITLVAFFFGRTSSYKGELSKTPPLTSLMSAAPLVSITCQIIVIVAVQASAFFQIERQPWYLSMPDAQNATGISSNVASYENYAVYSVSSFQYIILAFVFCKGPPYRSPLYSNYGLIISMIGIALFCAYTTVYPAQFLIDIFELILPPNIEYRCLLLAYPLGHFVIAWVLEHFFVDMLVGDTLRRKFHNINKSKKKYLLVEHKMKIDLAWPVVTPAAPPVSWVSNETTTAVDTLPLNASSLLGHNRLASPPDRRKSTLSS